MRYIKKTKEDLKGVEENCLFDNIKYPLSDLEDIEYYINQIEQYKELPFGVYVRGSSDGMDYWLQVEYWSEKLNKTIIWDYDWYNSIDNEEELLDIINRTAQEVVAFEKKIKFEE